MKKKLIENLGNLAGKFNKSPSMVPVFVDQELIPGPVFSVINAKEPKSIAMTVYLVILGSNITFFVLI